MGQGFLFREQFHICVASTTHGAKVKNRKLNLSTLALKVKHVIMPLTRYCLEILLRLAPAPAALAGTINT